jgi:hypothetical protein
MTSAEDAERADVAAKLAIGEVLARYCRAMDRMDRDLALSVWHADGTAHYDGFFEGTAAGAIDAIWEAHDRVWRHTHQIANTVIEVNGDRAASETYVTATMWGHPTDEGMFELVAKGRYLDRWSKRDGRWAIDHRVELGDVNSFRTLPPGSWLMASELATRDRTDPSYELFRSLHQP